MSLEMYLAISQKPPARYSRHRKISAARSGRGQKRKPDGSATPIWILESSKRSGMSLPGLRLAAT